MLMATVTPLSWAKDPKGREHYLKALDKACRDFEGVFLKQLVSTMHEGTTGEGLFGKDVASQVVADLHDGALADSLGQAGGVGLGKMLYAQLSKQVTGSSSGSQVKPRRAARAGGMQR